MVTGRSAHVPTHIHDYDGAVDDVDYDHNV